MYTCGPQVTSVDRTAPTITCTYQLADAISTHVRPMQPMQPMQPMHAGQSNTLPPEPARTLHGLRFFT